MKTNWDYRKIGDVCTVERGGSPRPIDDYITDSPDGINWIKIGDTSDSMFITQTAQKIIPEGMKKSRYVQPGDFLLSNSMSFGRPYILKIDGCIHDGWLVLRDNDEVFDKRFLYYYLSAKPTYEKFKSMAVGGVVNNLNSEMVRKVEVPIPEKVEQAQIADLLDIVNAVILRRKQQLSVLDDLVKARFVEMFDASTANRCKKRIGDYAQVFGGYAFKSDEFIKHAIPIIRISNINDGSITPDHDVCYPEEFWDNNPRFRALSGDILMAMSGATTGKAGICKSADRLLVNQRVACIRAIEGSSLPEYIYAVTQMPWMYNLIQEASAGCAQPNISGKQIENMPIPEASYEQQKSFAIFVAQIDKSKVVVQKALDEAQLLFDSLMQQCFA